MKYQILIGVFASIVVLLGLVVYQHVTLLDGKLHVIFCDVGQGDGIVIRTPKGQTLIVDGGPNDKILSCLSRHMPFWDRNVDLVVLTHPHADHLNGLVPVFARYSVGSFVTERLDNHTDGFQLLQEAIAKEKLTPQYVVAGSTTKTIDGVSIQILGPTQEFLEETSPNGMVGESGEFGSLLTNIQYQNFTAILTGDSQSGELLSGVDMYHVSSVSVLQIPHHGSKTGITDSLLDKLNPQLAVISVGKNKYGHPTKEILEKLRNKEIKTLRTDEVGDIEIVTDGKTFSIR